jgi:DNA mismatch endonuclease (patch repair protein)
MDTVSKKKRSEIMSKIRGKNTKPEIIVRKYLFSKGHRYRLHDKKLPGKPDIVMKKKKIAIQVRGCFWHGHSCKLANYPKTNRKYWKNKIDNNRKRDRKNDRLIKKMGYQLIVVNECRIGNKKLNIKFNRLS